MIRAIRLSIAGAAVLIAVASALAEPSLKFEKRLNAGVHFEGSPLYLVHDDETGTVIVGTGTANYEFPRGDAPMVVPLPAEDQVGAGGYLVPAPGGGAVVRIPGKQSAWSLYGLEGHSVSSAGDYSGMIESSGAWVLKPGYRGNVVVVGVPLDTAEGTSGRWSWKFWTDGRRVGEVITSKRVPLEIGPEGEVVGFLDTGSFRLFDRRANLKREVRGDYRKGALSKRGKAVLLNPFDSIEDVVIDRDNGFRRTVPIGSPVRGLRLSPDGDRAVVLLGDGRVRRLNPRTGELGETTRIPLKEEGRQFLSSALLDDEGDLTLGLLVRPRGAPSYQSGWIGLIREGQPPLSVEHPVDHVTSSVPEVVAAGEHHLAVRDSEGCTLYRIEQ